MKKPLIILIHAFIGWALCGASVGIGRSLWSMQTTLIVHAVAAPIIFGILSYIYHRKFNYTKPIITATIFVGFVIVMDFFIVALLIEKSFGMFASPLGTWIPFALLFAATYYVGKRA